MFKFKGAVESVISSRMKGDGTFIFFGLRRWWLAGEGVSDSERAEERYAACSTEGECAALFFQGLGSQDWKGMTMDSRLITYMRVYFL